MKCFRLHLRPKDGCPDYRSSAKVLLPNTKAERKDLGLSAPAKAPGHKVSLCDFCPVTSTIAKKKQGYK
jgi:hypothetical protein